MAESVVPWHEGTAYPVNALVTFEGIRYRCLQSHTAQALWNPKDAVTLWLENSSEAGANAAGVIDPLDVPYGAGEGDATAAAGTDQPTTGQPTGTDNGSAPAAPTSGAGDGGSGGGGGGGSEWAVGATYGVGDVCTYSGQNYQCRQAHKVDAANWTPPNTPALWRAVEGDAAPPPWEQNKKYNLEDRCSYGGGNYSCREAHIAYAANWIPPNTPALWHAE